MLTRSGPKLLDFGLAKPVRGAPGGETTTALTDSHTIVGTIHYMAPEQVEARDTDARTDLWALGVMLYEMATGQRPFGGDSAASVMSAILRDSAPLVSGDSRWRQPRSDHIIDRCLQKAIRMNGGKRWRREARAAVDRQRANQRRDGVARGTRNRDTQRLVPCRCLDHERDRRRRDRCSSRASGRPRRTRSRCRSSRLREPLSRSK
jgi:serine/threonine-protein kinase